MEGTEQPHNNRPSCSPQYPCNRFLLCPRCAARRQARFADIAERIEAAFGPLQFAVITPDENTAAAIRKAKHAAIRALTSPAALWTIEVGEQAGKLHMNLLGPNLKLPKIRGATIHQEQVRTSARACAAYMAKRGTYPHPSHYDGRALGSCGSLMQYLAESRSYPVAQAAALLKLIDTGTMRLARNQHPIRTDADALHDIAQRFADALDDMEKFAWSLGAVNGTIKQTNTGE